MKIGKNNKNAGFSMIELIVVMAIVAILAVSVASGVSLLSSRRVDAVAETILSSIERARVLTLGKQKNQVECVLVYDSANECYQILTFQGGECIDIKEMDANTVQIQVYFEGDATAYGLEQIEPYGVAGANTGSPSNGLFIQFDRASGAFVEETNQVGGAKKGYCNRIVVTNGSRTIQIHCVGITGKMSKD